MKTKGGLYLESEERQLKFLGPILKKVFSKFYPYWKEVGLVETASKLTNEFVKIDAKQEVRVMLKPAESDKHR